MSSRKEAAAHFQETTTDADVSGTQRNFNIQQNIQSALDFSSLSKTNPLMLNTRYASSEDEGKDSAYEGGYQEEAKAKQSEKK